MSNNDSLTLYRMIVLHMLNRVSHPLTSAQLADFMLYKEYTNFMTLQQILTELAEEALIRPATMGNRTLYSITDEGRQTLSFFDNRLQESIKDDIAEYLSTHEIEIRNELSIQTNYDKNAAGEYVAQLLAKDNDSDLIRIELTVPTEDAAARICQNWNEKNQDVYQYLVRELF